MDTNTSLLSPRWPWIIIVLSFLLAAVFMFIGRQTFKATEEATFEEFNERQLVLANGATSGIKLYFNVLADHLKSLGTLPGVQHFDNVTTRREILHSFESLRSLGVNDIAVLDSNGILKYNVAAPQIEGEDFSWRRYFQQARGKTYSGSYIIEFIEFKGVEAGHKGILVAVPIYATAEYRGKPTSSGKFIGVVVCTLTLDALTQKFIAPVRASERGHIFLIDNEYNILWSPDSSFFGRNLLRAAKGFPTFQSIIKKMAAGETGTAEYDFFKFDESSGRYTKEKEEKLIAYTPVQTGNTLWSIGVWAPKSDARKAIFSVYHKYQLLVGSIILIIFIGASYSLAVSSRISKALEKEINIKTGKLRESRNRLEAVKQIGALANSTLNLDEVLQRILRGTLEVSGASVGMIFLRDSETGSLSWGASIGLSEAFVASYRERHVQLGEGLTGRIAQTGDYIYIPRDVSHDMRIARHAFEAEGLNSFIGVPIYAADEIVGVMNILTRPPDVLSEDEITLTVAIGSHVGSAIRNAQLFEKLKQAMDALQESENKYRTLLENLPQKIFFKDRNSVYISCNENYARALNIRPDEVFGKTDYDFFPEELAEKYRADDRRIIESGVMEDIEDEYIQDGQKFFVQTVKTPVKDEDGNVIGILGIFWDITERKKAEEALRESEEKYRNVIDNIGVGISLISPKMEILSINKQMKEWFPNIDVSNKPICYKTFNNPPREEVCPHCPTIDTFKDGKVHESITITPVGDQVRYYRIISTPLKDNHGEIMSSIELVQDITEKMIAEEKIKQSLREKEMLLKEIHHRVKNNMQVISSLLNIQAQYIKDKQYVEIFNESKNRIKSMALVHEKLYRSEDLTNIDFNDYIKQLAHGLFTFYNTSTSRVALNINAAGVTLGIDSAIPCGLIINEILSNSLKHAFPGSRSGEINVTFKRAETEDEKEYELIISDNGVGIPPDLDIRETKTFGLQLITNLIEHQLQGSFDLQRQNGTKFIIHFKEPRYKKRI